MTDLQMAMTEKAAGLEVPDHLDGAEWQRMAVEHEGWAVRCC